VSAAAWGLVGVVVGGLITAFANYAAEWRQRRRQRNAAQATALIEIEEAREAIKFSKEGDWAVGWNLVTWNESWKAIQESLAGSLCYEPFRLVRLAYGSMFLLQRALQTKGGEEVSCIDRVFFERVEPRLSDAHAVLEGSKKPSAWSRWTKWVRPGPEPPAPDHPPGPIGPGG
jgi:hypothetical protein